MRVSHVLFEMLRLQPHLEAMSSKNKTSSSQWKTEQP